MHMSHCCRGAAAYKKPGLMFELPADRWIKEDTILQTEIWVTRGIFYSDLGQQIKSCFGIRTLSGATCVSCWTQCDGVDMYEHGCSGHWRWSAWPQGSQRRPSWKTLTMNSAMAPTSQGYPSSSLSGTMWRRRTLWHYGSWWLVCVNWVCKYSRMSFCRSEKHFSL